MSKFVVPFNWSQWEIDACERGVSRGWDSANYRAAYGDTGGETFESEGFRVATSLFLRGDERSAFLAGWYIGRTRFAAGEYFDGARDERDVYVRDNTSLQLRIMRLADAFRDFTISEERSHALFSQYRRLEALLQARLNARVTVKAWVTAHVDE